MDNEVERLPLLAAIVAALAFFASLAGFGAALDGYLQVAHPVGLLGARGLPHALAFNACGFVLPGVLAAFVAWRLRATVGDGGAWAARIGAWLALLSALAFAAQGLLPLDPRDLESATSRAHATAWTLWWVAFLPGATLLALGSLRRPAARVLVAASFAAAAAVAVLVLAPLDLLPPPLAQRAAFAAWFAWLLAVALAGGARAVERPRNRDAPAESL